MIPRLIPVLTATLLLAACAGLPAAPQTISQNIYLLDARAAIPAASAKRNLVLAVSMPDARPGFDTAEMVYVQQPYMLNYFATNRWAAAPARLLEPLLVQALEQSAGFRAVVPTAGAIPGDVRLETELVRLQQDFSVRPSRVQLTLRARLVDVHRKQVLAVTQFDEAETATSEDAYGGVGAANRALQRLLTELTRFCVAATSIQ
jgi:cholesterol transport system auxiliary component